MPPHDVVALLFQDDGTIGGLNAEPAADEPQQSRPLFAPDPFGPGVSAWTDTPLDLHSLAVARIIGIFEVAEKPSPIQHRVLARITYVHTIVHTIGR